MKIIHTDASYIHNNEIVLIGNGTSSCRKYDESFVYRLTDSFGISRDTENLQIIISDLGKGSSCFRKDVSSNFTILIDLDQADYLFSEKPFFKNLGLKTKEEKVAFILSHEIQHYLQGMNGIFMPTSDGKDYIWNGRIPMHKTILLIRLGLSEFSSYQDLPWEKDANNAAIAVVSTLYPAKKKRTSKKLVGVTD